MARPKTKLELIDAGKKQFERLLKQMESLTEKEKNTPFAFYDEKKKEAHWKRDKNLRDVLTHLYEWHQLALNWVRANQEGEGADFLPKPYNWKTYGEMNQVFWKEHQNTTEEKAILMLEGSHNQMMKVIESFSDKELFTKKHFTWTGTTSLGSYFVSATSSHYEWAIKKLKQHQKALKKL